MLLGFSTRFRSIRLYTWVSTCGAARRVRLFANTVTVTVAESIAADRAILTGTYLRPRLTANNCPFRHHELN